MLPSRSQLLRSEPQSSSVFVRLRSNKENLDPKLQKEVDAIINMQKEARGVSLVEMHRQKKVEEKKGRVVGEGGKGDWSWSRDKDLDAGRRVDKNHLHMVMGGATTDLKNKFQGSYSKGFM